ncbi:MAG: sensor histidine kinase [Flavipsychrobacter sp.]
MKKALQLLYKFLTGRLFRNLLFWFFFLNMQYNNTVTAQAYAGKYYILFATIVNLLAMIFTYTNNLYLVPHFLVKKRYGRYFSLVISLVLVFSVVYTMVLKVIINHYPLIKIEQISPITSPVSQGWTISDFIYDAGWYAIGWSIWLVLLTGAWYMNYFQRVQKDSVRAMKEAELMVLESKKQQQLTELNFLKAQLNPHFLFNTLNNLYALSLKKSDDAPDAILQLSSILRYLLYESNVETIPFEKEKEIMEAYIDLELLRLTDKNNLSFIISADMPYSIPPLLWLPVLENVFKHGTRIISEQHFVDYRFIIEHNKVLIYSKNNSKFLNGNKEKECGIGLTNLRKRLELLYPDRHSINITTTDNYYIIEVNIDLA